MFLQFVLFLVPTKFIKLLLPLFFAFLLISNPLYSQTTIGARASALGGSAVCLKDEWSTFNNQAWLGFNKKTILACSYENRFYIKEINTSALTFNLALRKGSIGLSYKAFGYSLYKESTYGISYGLGLNEHFAFGVQLNYQNITQGDIYSKWNKVYAEAGFIAKLNPTIIIGGHFYTLDYFKNRNNQCYIDLGIKYKVSDKINSYIDFEKNLLFKSCLKCGLEYQLKDKFFLRGGLMSYPLQITCGFGIKFDHWGIDVAAQNNAVLGSRSQLSLAYCFNHSNKPKIEDE